ncbi:hypothetical protein A0H81_09344 [Grifola frondosa]|uniref:BTB domain-containing protein n=1 Tax=Grifola frondosa TaxID=5627 RepID=A0A1C7M3K5_GRIFR|nr:hypothetical protein A0H81_09344 [Grifola frondosa]
MADDGSRKRQRLETGAATDASLEIQRDEEFWFRDGSIVLIARNIAFRVYQGLIAEQSDIFRDLFAVPQPMNPDMMDDCPAVHLSDSPEDLRHLLRVLLPSQNRYFLKPLKGESIDFAEVSAIIRLAHKYGIQDVQDQALSYLKISFTDKFSDHIDDHHEGPVAFELNDVRAIAVVNLARLVGADSMLPVALYRCSQLGSEIIHGFSREDGTREQLTADDLGRCINGKMALVRASVMAAFRILLAPLSAEACMDGHCGRKDLAHVLDDLAQDDDLITYRVLTPWLPECDMFCKNCHDTLLSRDLKERRNIWLQLPSFMGVAVEGWGGAGRAN